MGSLHLVYVKMWRDNGTSTNNTNGRADNAQLL